MLDPSFKYGLNMGKVVIVLAIFWCTFIVGNCDPGIFKYNGTYYMLNSVVRDSKIQNFDLQYSKNLLTWEPMEEPMFRGRKFNDWTVERDDVSPAIHKIGDRFNLYFYAKHPGHYGFYNNIGMATAKTVTGPYTEITIPLLQSQNQHARYPHIARDGM